MQFHVFLSFCFCVSKCGRIHVFNSVILLFQTALPLELPQAKPKRNDEGKGLGMQFKGPLGPGGKGSVPELKPAAAGLGKDSPSPGPAKGSQKPASSLPSAADHLEEELDLLLNLDAPVKAEDDLLPDQIPQALESEKDGEVVAQEEKGMVFTLFPNRVLDSSVVVRTASPVSHPYLRPSVSTPIWRCLLTSISVLTSPPPPR